VREVELRRVSLGFGSGAARTSALRGIDLTLEPGTFTVISGPSGSGKTSLISILGAMIAPDTGSVMTEGIDIAKLSMDGRTAFRREKIGYVFQSFRLMPGLDADENIRLSLEIRRVANVRQRSLAALDLVGLAAKAHLRPDEMSHGEKQRVAIARAIAHAPMMVLADEPTASLDAANGIAVTGLLADIARDTQRIVAVVTHDPRMLPVAQRIVRLDDGRIAGDEACRPSD
jgi:putative ABC transport system ATP-binding protein